MPSLLHQALVYKFQVRILQGKRTRTTPPTSRLTWLHPVGMVEDYRKFITQTLENWYKPFEAQMEQTIEAYFPRFKADAAEEEWEEINLRLLDEQQRLFSEEQKGNFLGAIFPFGEPVNAFNAQEFQKFMKGAIGEPLPMAETWVQPMIQQWADTNYDLIKKMSDNYIAKTNDIVKNAVANGLTYSEVMADLRKAGATTTVSHARLVARDQIGKLNGAMTQARMEEAGISEYLWSTSADERVRGNPRGRYPKAIPSHFLIDQKICRWDDKTVWKDAKGKWVKRDLRAPWLHPGEDIQCRCSAIPVMDEIWEAAYKEAERLTPVNVAAA